MTTIASKQQAENGTDNTTVMTPLRTKQSIQANSGPSGTTNYNDLTNKPKINNVELSGNKTSANLGLQPTLVSGTNIKTVNNTSLLGSGNVSVQPTLVSGTNIKTINNQSLLGSGNITIQGGGGSTYYFDGQNNAANLAMINEICHAFDNGDEINFTGKFADYATGQIFQAPINVVKYDDGDGSYDSTFNNEAAFISDPVLWVDPDSWDPTHPTIPATYYYLTFALYLEGTWGNYTSVGEYRRDTINTPVASTNIDNNFKTGQTINGEVVVNSIRTKNMLSIIDGTYSDNGITAVVSNGVITINGTATNLSQVQLPLQNNFDLVINQNYTLSANNTSTKGGSTTETYCAIRFLLTSDANLGEVRFTSVNAYKTFHLNHAGTIQNLTIRTASGQSYTNFVIKPQFEIGSTPTTYAKYQNLETLDTGWIKATLTSAFTHNTNRELKYRKYGDIVTICGTVSFTAVPSWGDTITTLPVGYRPRTEIDVWCRLTNNNYPCLIAITAGGKINYLTANNNSTPNASNAIWIYATYIVA